MYVMELKNFLRTEVFNLVGIGVVGIGSWGSRVLSEYYQLAEEKVIDRVYSCDIAGDADFKYYKDLLGKVDGVHLCVPNDAHYILAKFFLSNGMNVLLEKPMSLSKTSAYDLIEVASENGCVLQVGFIFRFANVVRALKEMYDNKTFGKIRYFSMHWTTMSNPIRHTDILWDLLPHPLDIVYFITGRFPNSWNYIGRFFRRDKDDELAIINFDYNDFIASVELSWITPWRRRRLYLVGEDASAVVELVDQTITLYLDGKPKVIEVVQNNTIKEEALNFIECIKDKKNRFNSHIVGARNTEVIEAMLNE